MICRGKRQKQSLGVASWILTLLSVYPKSCSAGVSEDLDTASASSEPPGRGRGGHLQGRFNHLKWFGGEGVKRIKLIGI